MRSPLYLSLIIVFAAHLGAQVETSSSIRGLVQDSSGAMVSAASVTALNVATGQKFGAVTDSSGSYSIPVVPPGTYNVSVDLAGFKKSEVRNLVAGVGQAAQVDFVLQVGDTADTITVSAAGAELISTTSADISGIVGEKLVANLPLNGRNFFDLAVTLPHVSPQSLGTQLSFASLASNGVFGANAANPIFRSSGIFAAGNRDSATNVSIDGLNVQISVYGQTITQEPPSAIQEMKVVVSGMNAEFGNGVANVNVITKSGSNQLHGEMYEFLRNDALDANYFFSNITGRAKPPYRQNQFGGAIGGPVIHNKLFIFGAYEGLRIRQSVPGNETVPSDDIRAGDFSNYHPRSGSTILSTPTIYNPYQYNPVTGLRVPFPGNKIPLGATGLCAPQPTCVDPVTSKFLDLAVSRPNTEIDGVPTLYGLSSNRLDSDQGIVRVDYSLSLADHIYGRYTNATSPSSSRGLQPLEGTTNDSSSQSTVVHWTRTVSPASVNDLFLGYSRPKWNLARRLDVPDIASQIGLVNTSGFPGGPTFSVSGFSMDTANTTILNATENLYQLGDDFSYVHGRHTLKIGGQAILRRLYYPRSPNDKGTFTFGPTYSAACAVGNAACNNARNAAGVAQGGLAFADYLLGSPGSKLLQINSSPYRGSRKYYGAFVQDSWRATQRLTVNLGLRYEYWSPWEVSRNTTFVYDEVTGTLTYVLKNPLDYLDPSKGYGHDAPLNTNLPRAGYRTTAADFAPRAGLAYSLSSKTVLRAGYGIYYDANINMNQFADIQTSVAPFTLRDDVTAATSEQLPSIHVAGNFPYPGPTTIPYPNGNPVFSFRFPQPVYPASQVQEWSVSVQHRLSANWALEASYEGTHAIHLNQFIDANAPALQQGAAATLSLQQRRRHPEWGPIGTWAPMGYSRYNAGALSLHNNQWHGLTLISSLTFAKNIGSGQLGNSDQGNQAYYAPYIWQGPVRLTPRLRYVTSFSYDLPFGHGKAVGGSLHGLPQAVVSGWRLSGTVDTTTGIPNFVTTTDVSGTTYGTMPDRICDARNVPGGQTRLHWFNTSCFQQPAFGTWGNSNFGVYEDPGIANLNASIMKSVSMHLPTEDLRLELRADLFNALNHTQWGPAVNATVQSGNVNAGQITSTRTPRQLQVALRLVF